MQILSSYPTNTAVVEKEANKVEAANKTENQNPENKTTDIADSTKHSVREQKNSPN
jgi:hypothetical protein